MDIEKIRINAEHINKLISLTQGLTDLITDLTKRVEELEKNER